MANCIRHDVATLTGEALDWAVATSLGGEWKKYRFAANEDAPLWDAWVFPDGLAFSQFKPSTDWAHGGPLVQRFQMNFMSACTGSAYPDGSLRYDTVATIGWRRTINGKNAYGRCSDHVFLRAACRAIVTAFKGDHIELPAQFSGEGSV